MTASLDYASYDDEIYGYIASRGTINTNTKGAKEDDDEEGRMMGILQFWVCAMGHMEVVAKLTTERDIDYFDHLTGITCPDFEDGTGVKLCFTFDINTNE